jgi:hypothetical protein
MRYSTAGMAFLLLLVLTAAACSPVMTIGLGDGVRGSGNMITETRDVSDFSGVQLMTSGNATITVGEANSLTIEAEDNIMPLLTSEVRSGVLELGTASNTSISTSRGWQYTITVESLDLLEITGSGDATVNGTVDSNLRVQIAGSGDAISQRGGQRRFAGGDQRQWGRGRQRQRHRSDGSDCRVGEFSRL